MQINYYCLDDVLVKFNVSKEAAGLLYEAAVTSDTVESFDVYLRDLTNAATDAVQKDYPFVGQATYITYPSSISEPSQLNEDSYYDLDIDVWGTWLWDEPLEAASSQNTLRFEKDGALIQAQAALLVSYDEQQALLGKADIASLTKSLLQTRDNMLAFLEQALIYLKAYNPAKLPSSAELVSASQTYEAGAADSLKLLQDAMQGFEKLADQAQAKVLLESANIAFSDINEFGLACDQIVFVSTADGSGKGS